MHLWGKKVVSEGLITLLATMVSLLLAIYNTCKNKKF
jgi:hypothetical protein